MKKALIIGSGLCGSTAARVLAENNWKVEIHEMEYYVGGHVRTSEYNGILYEQNGIHVNHTNNDTVINFIQRFSKWISYVHYIQTETQEGLFSWPLQISEIAKMSEWEIIKKEISLLPKVPDPTNFETYATSIMGQTLYNTFVLPYTIKQWKMDPKNLSSSIAPKRIGLRYDGNLPIFLDKWQGWPEGGWTKLVENILNHDNINILMGIQDTEKTIPWNKYDCVIVTAPLDDFLDSEQLEWRGVRVEHSYIPGKEGFYLSAGQINYPGLDKEYTRRTETKHMSGQKDLNGTIVTYEYPDITKKHYPVYDVKGINKMKSDKLKKSLLEKYPNAIIAGRLANYVYINTDQAIMQGINAAQKAMNTL